MNDYLLFIDTETSGLPKNWHAPFSEPDNWPYAVQVAWIIYTKDGLEVKQESHYIKEDDIDISPEANKIHGITRRFLYLNGKRRKYVMSLLANDLNQYQPLAIAHFMQLDALIAGVEFYRTGIENPLTKLPSFCTMQATAHLVRNPAHKYLRLDDLYTMLFKTPVHNNHDYHDALSDAKATAECFFELVKRGDITEKTIAQQQKIPKPTKKVPSVPRYIFTVLILLLLALIILFFLWKANFNFFRK